MVREKRGYTVFSDNDGAALQTTSQLSESSKFASTTSGYYEAGYHE